MKQKYRVNWTVEGDKIGDTLATHPVPNGYPNPPCRFEKDDIVEANPSEVRHMVALKFGGDVPTGDAVLTPVAAKAIKVIVPGADVDLRELEDEQLAQHASTFHGMNGYILMKKHNPGRPVYLTQHERGTLIRDMLESRAKQLAAVA